MLLLWRSLVRMYPMSCVPGQRYSAETKEMYEQRTAKFLYTCHYHCLQLLYIRVTFSRTLLHVCHHDTIVSIHVVAKHYHITFVHTNLAQLLYFEGSYLER